MPLHLGHKIPFQSLFSEITKIADHNKKCRSDHDMKKIDYNLCQHFEKTFYATINEFAVQELVKNADIIEAIEKHRNNPYHRESLLNLKKDQLEILRHEIERVDDGGQWDDPIDSGDYQNYAEEFKRLLWTNFPSDPQEEGRRSSILANNHPILELMIAFTDVPWRMPISQVQYICDDGLSEMLYYDMKNYCLINAAYFCGLKPDDPMFCNISPETDPYKYPEFHHGFTSFYHFWESHDGQDYRDDPNSSYYLMVNKLKNRIKNKSITWDDWKQVCKVWFRKFYLVKMMEIRSFIIKERKQEPKLKPKKITKEYCESLLTKYSRNDGGMVFRYSEDYFFLRLFRGSGKFEWQL